MITGAAREGKNDIAALWGINTRFYLDNNRGASLAALSALRTVLQTLGHEQLSFLFRSDIMDENTLENAVNGIFIKPNLKKKISTLIKGFVKPTVLLQLNRGIQS